MSVITKFIKHPIVINLILMIVVTIGIIIGVLTWLDHYTRHNQAVVVPDVKGLTVNEAAQFFESNGLRYNVIDSVFSKDVAPGAIVELVPSAGSKVKEGRIVFITVNALTSQMASLPEVEDLSFRQAYALLKAAGFTNIEIVYKPGEYKDLAMGIETNGKLLTPGEYIPLSAPLELLVSNGEPEELEMPDDSTAVESIEASEEDWF
ncbi:PASTA domain-containing protein [Parabacteroides pacaensis]|uniref:PASTA domain-containing protein n=1 Tax=Parabacteroides pacaensis TaxID=2086575 RepID=UPI000D101CF7|nr:PASTA domain-containing protein [Parabacteroides pacaensis]